MPAIVTITLAYVETEDRISVAMRLDDGTVMALWLTQRLARRLVSALAGHLEKAEAIPLPTVRDAVMAQEQAQAVSTIRPAAPVAITPQAPLPIITNITLNLAADKVDLQFVSALDERPSVTLDRTLVRQWLSMLHRQFVAAEWPQDVWPLWLTEGSAAPGRAMTRH